MKRIALQAHVFCYSFCRPVDIHALQYCLFLCVCSSLSVRQCLPACLAVRLATSLSVWK